MGPPQCEDGSCHGIAEGTDGGRLGREELRRVVDDLGIEGVDRRSVMAMRTVLRRSRRVGAEELLHCLRKDGLSAICSELCLPVTGRRDELVERLLTQDSGTAKIRTRKSGRTMSQDAQRKLDFEPNGQAAQSKKAEKLTLARLERRLFEACDILRGQHGRVRVQGVHLRRPVHEAAVRPVRRRPGGTAA